MSSIRHLARRWWRSLSRQAPAAADLAWVREFLTAAEWGLWTQLSPADQRHSIEVARRYEAARGSRFTDEMAGALLHDIGKLESGLGTSMRVIATIVGPRTRRFRLYHLHEELGAAMLTDRGSSPTTVAMVAGQGPLMSTLHQADDV